MSRKASEKAHRRVVVRVVPLWRRVLEYFLPNTAAEKDIDQSSDDSSEEHRSSRLRVDMIRRTDNAPQLVNPSGWISAGRTDFFASNREMQQKAQQKNSDELELQSPQRYLAFADIDNPSLVENAIRTVDKRLDRGETLSPVGEAPDSAGLSDVQSFQTAQSNDMRSVQSDGRER